VLYRACGLSPYRPALHSIGPKTFQCRILSHSVDRLCLPPGGSRFAACLHTGSLDIPYLCLRSASHCLSLHPNDVGYCGELCSILGRCTSVLTRHWAQYTEHVDPPSMVLHVPPIRSCPPLRAQRQTVTVDEWCADSERVTRTCNYGHWADHANLHGAGSMTHKLNSHSVISDSATGALLTVTSSHGSSRVPSESPASSSVLTTQQAPCSAVTSAVISMSSVTVSSPPIESATLKGTSSAPAIGEQSPKGDVTIFPSA